MPTEETSPAAFEGDAPAASTAEVLPDRRELALVAVERTRMPMVVTDPRRPDNPIVLANHAFLDLTGYQAEEVIGRNCRLLQGPGTAPADIAAIREGLARRIHIDVELLNYRKDGTTFWNQLSISPVVDEAGTLLYHFASQKDVTARRRAEEMENAERRLLREVDHRAMNALALVQSFVRLGRTDSIEAYARSVQERVDTLARAHRILAQNGWKSAEIGDLVAMETPGYAATRVRASGAVVALSAHVVQPVALVLHELMANAVAYGALAAPEGALAIRWHRAAGRTALSWREYGAPSRNEAPAEGLGLSLVRGLIERQLQGSVTLNWTADGLDAELVFAPDDTPAKPHAAGSRPSRPPR